MDEKDVVPSEESSDLSTMSDAELESQLAAYTEEEALEMQQAKKGYTDEEIDAMLQAQLAEDKEYPDEWMHEDMEEVKVKDLTEEPKEEKPLKDRVDEKLQREQASDQIMALLESQQWSYEEAYKLMRAAELVCNDAYWRERRAEPTTTTQTTIYYTGNGSRGKTTYDDDSYGVNSNYGTGYGGTSTVGFNNSNSSFRGITKNMTEEEKKKFDEIKKKHEE
jgi:hypothetical protein